MTVNEALRRLADELSTEISDHRHSLTRRPPPWMIRADMWTTNPFSLVTVPLRIDEHIQVVGVVTEL